MILSYPERGKLSNPAGEPSQEQEVLQVLDERGNGRGDCENRLRLLRGRWRLNPQSNHEEAPPVVSGTRPRLPGSFLKLAVPDGLI